ncbi:hypothetical protein SLS62_004360 [Diatrype stigma]|uniref:DUF7603 domain-containing protein n=1 Tax=Diatrype stigma TaxID=117547 RepID=A0AAN9UUL1_9PEZI
MSPTMSPTMAMSGSTAEPDLDMPAASSPANHHLDPSASSPVADSETPYASHSSTTFPPTQATPSASASAASPDHAQDLDSVPDLPDLPVSRNIQEFASDPSAPPQRASLQQIRRKPVSLNASSLATRYSSGEYLTIEKSLPMPEPSFSRSYSLDSPTVYAFPSAVSRANPIPNPDFGTKPQTFTTNKENFLDIDDSPVSAQFDPASVSRREPTHPSTPDGGNPAGPQTGHPAELSQLSDRSSYDDLLGDEEEDQGELHDEDPLSDNILDGYNSDNNSDTSSYSIPNSNPNPENSPTMSLHISKKTQPPHLNLQAVTPQPNDAELRTPNTDKPLPKSPGSSKLGNFFGWGAGSPSSTANSDKAVSPSPFNFSKANSVSDASPTTTVGPQSFLGPPKGHKIPPNTNEYYLATPSTGTYSPYLQIEEMEDELKAISAELAASIRREIDLEDLAERLQAERDNPSSTSNKRTSDYFSDSGYSSAKFSEYDQSREEIEKIQRRAEQEKAQVRLELTNKLQDERSRRQQLDTQIRELSEKASQIDLAQVNNLDANDRVKELESTCETLRRKLSEEREVKDNFEDLLAAMRGELQDASNERDNLRDEIVPQLRARVEGLEGQAAELEKMTYESSKMQQELHNLKTENFNLKEHNMKSMDMISEEDDMPQFRRSSRPNSIIGPGLSRSNSISSSLRLGRPPSLLMRSKTVKTSESRDQIAERLKDVEEQRDALHRALKSLLDRQEYQNRENEKKIQVLELERDRLLSASPQKASFQKEVTNLRVEINVLRRRSEEALEQKWQVEKGLGGLKMDLDRAEQEITSLRSLLSEKDILIPPSLARSSTGSDQLGTPITSEALTTAYEALQKAYADALERIKNLERTAPTLDEKTQLAMEKLERALSSTITERDFARQEASSYKEQLDALKAGEQQYLDSEKALSDELMESARRVEELAVQVRQQLSINQTLRQRISDTVSRGEGEQRANKERITAMQARLRVLEERLDAAQNASEERITRHEEEMQALKDGNNAQLSRMRDSLRSSRSGRAFPPKSPLSPLFTAPGARPPQINSTRSGPAMKVSEEAQVDNLRARIAELENALTDADSEMEQVVSRMNIAQIEVLQLQEEREAAVNRTRKLERELEAEKLRSFEGRFKSLQA